MVDDRVCLRIDHIDGVADAIRHVDARREALDDGAEHPGTGLRVYVVRVEHWGHPGEGLVWREHRRSGPRRALGRPHARRSYRPERRWQFLGEERAAAH